MTAEEMVSRLLYRDGLMLVLDKPPGMSVHAGPKNRMQRRESIEDHFDALRFGLPRPPALAHRLDRDTSGCLVLGRHHKALAELGKLFKSGAIDKTYWAIVEGSPQTDEGVIDLPLGRLDETRGWWMKHDPAGRPAVTKWKVMGRASSLTSPWRGEVPGQSVAGGDPHLDPLSFKGRTEQGARASLPPEGGELEWGSGKDVRVSAEPLAAKRDEARSTSGAGLTWLELEPLTGRTHQLRVHCAEMGWPIVGDAVYGNAPRDGGPILHLLAREIVVPLYKNREPIRAVAPAPGHMRVALAACGWKGEEIILPRATRENE